MSDTVRWSMRVPAEPDTRLSPNAWDGQIGKRVPVNILDYTGRAKLIDAEVAADGQSVTLTFESDPQDAISAFVKAIASKQGAYSTTSGPGPSVTIDMAAAEAGVRES